MAALAILAVLAGCAKKPPAVYGETPEYWAWKAEIGPPIQAASFATKIDGSIDFQLGDRPCTEGDWIEVYYQGEYQRRTYIYSPPDKPPRILRHDFRLMTGPMNRIHFFDTVTNRGYKFMIDTRTIEGQAPDIVFTPGGPDGFTMSQSTR